MKVKVNVFTRSEFLGNSNDYAEVEITDSLGERIRTFCRTLNELGADFLHEFDYGPDFHFVDEDTWIDVVQLVVAKNGDFWWEGYIKHTDVRWETGSIPFALLDEPEGGEQDLREYKEEGEQTAEMESSEAGAARGGAA